LAPSAALAEVPGFRRAEKSRLFIPNGLREEPESRPPRARRQSQQIGRGFAADPWPFASDNAPTHPGYGLTPARVLRIFRESEGGNLRELQDLYDDLLESDGHLRSLIESRISAVSGKARSIQPGGDDDASKAAAEALRDAIEDGDIEIGDTLEHHLEAQFRGFSCTEISWGLHDNLWVPVRFDDVAHRRFVFRPGPNEIRLSKTEQLHLDIRGEELIPNKWIVSKARHSNLARAGALRTATWWALFKRMGVRDFIVLAERFGIPHVLGYYDENASDESKEALEHALKDLGEGGQAVLSELTKIVVTEAAQRSGDISSVHPVIIKICDTENSKLIMGATLTTDSGGPGSYALGNVHQNRLLARELADANRFSQVFRRSVSVPFVKINGFAAAGAKPPLLSILVFPTLAPKERVEILSMFVNDMGMKVDGWDVATQLGFRRPTRDEDAAMPTRAPGQPARPSEPEEEIQP
jgi:phage gp29-like protein